MLYRLLTHEWPWPAGPSERTAHLFLEPADLPPIAGVPPTVGPLYRRCLAKDPRPRPSAREVAAILTAAAGSPVTEAVPTSMVTAVPFWNETARLGGPPAVALPAEPTQDA